MFGTIFVASPDAPTTEFLKLGGAYTKYRGMGRFHADRLVGNWGRTLDERQEIRHPVDEIRTSGTRQRVDGWCRLTTTYASGDC